MPKSPLAVPRAPPTAFRWFELASIVAALALDATLASRVLRGFGAHSPGLGALVAAALGAYVAADVLSGIVHFLGDSFGTVDTPWLGTTFVLPFRSHHTHPEAIAEHDFIETNGNNAFATLLPVVPTLLLVPVEAGGAATGLGCFVLVLALLLLFTNQIHKWAHVAAPPGVVRMLQRAGILLSPERHAAHHSPPYRGGFCVVSGHANGVLDPIAFFPRLEGGLRKTLGLTRRHA